MKILLNICLLAVASTMSQGARAADVVDPMRPPMAPSVIGPKAVTQAPVGPRLTAVLFSADRRVAIIDGRAVQEGARVRDMSVLEIFADGVRLGRAGQPVQTLRLPKSVTPMKVRVTAENEP